MAKGKVKYSDEHYGRKAFAYSGKEQNIYFFKENVARVYGVECAVMIDNIAYWVEKNKENPKSNNFKEGRWWMYNTVEMFAMQYPFWSVSQVRRILKNCVVNGALIKGSFNKHGYDRTIWYTLSDDALTLVK